MLVLEGNAWAERVLRDDPLIASPVLPGLNCRVAALWVGVMVEDQEE